tara:strand:- start:3418 stop:4143 length:726 start_codon:yes stop_codon:yes gene_type:complete
MAAFAAMALTSQAATVTLNGGAGLEAGRNFKNGADNLGGGTFGTINNFVGSTNTQFGTMTIDLASLISQFEVTVGVLGAGEAYQINSSTLTAGIEGDGTNGDTDVKEFNTAADVHLSNSLFDVYDSTYNEAFDSLNTAWTPPSGAISAANFGTSIQTGDAATTDYSTSWNGLTSVLQDWVDGTVDNEGLIFSYAGNEGRSARVAEANISWEMDVSIVAVPEPSSAALLGLGGLALILRRRK